MQRKHSVLLVFLTLCLISYGLKLSEDMEDINYRLDEADGKIDKLDSSVDHIESDLYGLKYKLYGLY